MRLALRWLSDNAPVTAETIEQAGIRFDLSPIEEEFFYHEFIVKTKAGKK
jgi:hypothetical protein